MNKTMPEFFDVMLKVVGCEPQETIFVDDDPKHIEVSTQCNIPAFLYQSPDVEPLVEFIKKHGIDL